MPLLRAVGRPTCCCSACAPVAEAGAAAVPYSRCSAWQAFRAARRSCRAAALWRSLQARATSSTSAALARANCPSASSCAADSAGRSASASRAKRSAPSANRRSLAPRSCGSRESASFGGHTHGDAVQCGLGAVAARRRKLCRHNGIEAALSLPPCRTCRPCCVTSSATCFEKWSSSQESACR